MYPLVTNQIVENRPAFFDPSGRRGRIDNETDGVRVGVVAGPEGTEISLTAEIPELENG